jgi:peptide/nickel transport system substrate-binding protein
MTPLWRPTPFNPVKARQLLHDAGYPDGLAVTVIATQALEVQATVISKMLEQVGFKVELHILDPGTFNQKTYLSHLDRPAAQQVWDIALFPGGVNVENFPVFEVYHYFELDGPQDWVIEQPELRRLYEQVLQTVDRERQQGLIRQMERHTAEQAYFLFLYNPIKLYAVNKAVEFVPYVSGVLKLDKTAVTEQHWSVRQ